MFARVLEVAGVGPTGRGGIAEDLVARDARISPVFTVEDHAFEGDEIAGPTGGVTEQVGIEDHGFVVIAAEVLSEVNGDSLVGDVRGWVRCLDTGGEERAVIHRLPGWGGVGYGGIQSDRECERDDRGGLCGGGFEAWQESAPVFAALRRGEPAAP